MLKNPSFGFLLGQYPCQPCCTLATLEQLLALNARSRHGPDLDYLRLSLAHSPAQITSSGLDKQVAATEKRLQKQLDQANDLFAPLGLSREELQSAVFHILRKETPK